MIDTIRPQKAYYNRDELLANYPKLNDLKKLARIIDAVPFNKSTKDAWIESILQHFVKFGLCESSLGILPSKSIDPAVFQNKTFWVGDTYLVTSPKIEWKKNAKEPITLTGKDLLSKKDICLSEWGFCLRPFYSEIKACDRLPELEISVGDRIRVIGSDRIVEITSIFSIDNRPCRIGTSSVCWGETFVSIEKFKLKFCKLDALDLNYPKEGKISIQDKLVLSYNFSSPETIEAKLKHVEYNYPYLKFSKKAHGNLICSVEGDFGGFSKPQELERLAQLCQAASKIDEKFFAELAKQ